MIAGYNQGNFELNEFYREVRTYLVINKNTKIILITSAEMNEGKTTIACNIATCFSKLENTKVLLIDCDFAKKGVSRYFVFSIPKYLLTPFFAILHKKE